MLQQGKEDHKNKKQLILQQSLKILESQMLLTESNNVSLQSNVFLLKMLQGQFRSASEEAYAYLTAIRPTIISFSITQPAAVETFIYRFADSKIGTNDFVYSVIDSSDFSYGKEILDDIKKVNSLWLVELDPQKSRHFNSSRVMPPKLICFSKIYDGTYSNVIGIVEIQLDLNKMINLLGFLVNNDNLYIKHSNLYYPIEKGLGLKVLYDQPLANIPGGHAKDSNIVSMKLDKTDLEFVYQYKTDTLLDDTTLFHILLVVCILFIPTAIFMMYLYRFTGRLVKFSNHISKTHQKDLSQYDDNASKDEFGIVINEYNYMIQTIKSLIVSVYDMEKQKNEANYYAMQSQIDPHFLFNTLENIRMHVDIKEYDDVSSMLFALSRLMRYNISMRRESTLSKEFEHIRNYLLLYQYRQVKRISFQLQSFDISKDIKCPFCILQPIVENCIKHGIRNFNDKIHISITYKCSDKGIDVEVRDTGAGMPEDQAERINESLRNNVDIDASGEHGSIGLKNVNGRIKYFYGNEYGVSFRTMKPNGLTCTLALGWNTRNNLVDELIRL
jgi:two-component system sensor histidine kinase YesM